MAEERRVSRARGLGLLGFVLFLAAGAVGERRPALPFTGEVRTEGRALRLGAGAQVELGRGAVLAAETGGGAMELHLGDEGLARVARGTIQLLDAEGRGLVSVAPRPLASREPPWIRCGERLEAGAGNAGVDHGPPRPRCGPQPARLRALEALRLEGAWLDGRPVKLVVGPRPELRRLLMALPVGLGLLLLLGPAALWPLLLSPLAPALPVIPATATLSLLGGACGLVRGGARGWALAGLALLLAAGSVLVRPAPGPTAAVVAPSWMPSVGPAVLERKVDELVRATGPALAGARRPLVVALGGSSSGGGTAGRFWPQILDELLGGRAQVVSLAWGGATSWHLLRALQRLEVRAELCVAYIGHNDLSVALPGRTIRQILADEPARGSELVAPVPLEDAGRNLQAMRAHCGVLLAIQERVAGREAVMAGYAAMLRGQEGVDWLDGQQLVSAGDLMDDVHLHPAGHERLARALLPEVERRLSGP